MVSDVYEFDIPEVRLFFRFCEHTDGDALPVGKEVAPHSSYTFKLKLYLLASNPFELISAQLDDRLG